MSLPKNEPIQKCKHCGYQLNSTNIKSLPKKKLPERHGVCWGGLEFPYIQIFKVSCPNLSCGKKYSYKHKLINFLNLLD